MIQTRTTKERILGAAKTIMLEKGFHAVGLNEILKSEQVPKGSFYHHFESKEQCGVEMLRYYVSDASAHKRRMLLSSAPEANPRLRLITYLESIIASFIANDGKCPCLVLKLASEVSDFSESMRQVLVDGYQEWIGITEAAIREGLEKGALRCEMEPRLAAMVINDFWTGALQRASVERNSEPLRETLSFITQRIILHPS